MPEISAPIKKIIEDFPNSTKLGTIENNVAQNAYRLAHARGMDENSEELAAFVREQIEMAPGVASGESAGRQENRGGGDRGGGSKVKLSEQEREIAKISGISPEEYSRGKVELVKYKRQGMYGMSDVV